MNLFDYDIPDDWHYVSDNKNTQGDVQLRFVSESSNNTGDGAVNRVNSRRRSTPYTGILQDTLNASTGLPTFNYTTPFANLGGLFSLTDGKQNAGTAYKWAISTNETTLVANPSSNAGDLVHQLARPDSPETWYNDSTGSSEKTYQNVRTKDVYAGVNFDFVYDEDSGYYSYDSSQNHAQLSDDGTEVHQYDHALGLGGTPNKWSYKSTWGSNSYGSAVSDTNGSSAAGFFPFDTWYSRGNGDYGQNHYGKKYSFQPAWSKDDTTELRKEEDLDYHFGMSTTQTFAVPEGGQVKGHDMAFSFSGDDDFWLYVDGKLVLDIGGIHGRCPGSINFTKGTYTVNGVTKSLNDIFDGYKASFPNADSASGLGSWAAGTAHTFSIFYLERGGTFSNLAMRFNLPTVTTSAQKVWDDNENAAGARKDAKLYLEKTEGEVTKDSTWTKVDGSERTIKADAANTTVVWSGDEYPMQSYDKESSKSIPVYYRMREEGTASNYTSQIQIKTSAADTWAQEGEDGYDAALTAGGATTWKVTNTYKAPNTPKTPEKPKAPKESKATKTVKTSKTLLAKTNDPTSLMVPIAVAAAAAVALGVGLHLRKRGEQH